MSVYTPEYPLPSADNVAALLLALRTDERGLIWTAGIALSDDQRTMLVGPCPDTFVRVGQYGRSYVNTVSAAQPEGLRGRWIKLRLRRQ